MPVASDAQLLARARSGETDAYFELWGRHEEFARRTAGFLTRNPHDRDDLVAAARDRIWTAIGNGHGPTLAFRSYLATTLRNTATTHYRGAPVPIAEPVATDAAAPPGPDVEAEVVMRSAFESLSPRHQEVLTLTEVSGLAPADVADHLGLSPNAVAQLAHRARRALRYAWIDAHMASTAGADPACRKVRHLIRRLVAGDATSAEEATVDEHVEDCDRCRAAYLGALDSGFRRSALTLAVLGIGLDGWVAAGTVGSAGSGAGALGARPDASSGAGAGSGAGSGAARPARLARAGGAGPAAAALAAAVAVALVVASALAWPRGGDDESAGDRDRDGVPSADTGAGPDSDSDPGSGSSAAGPNVDGEAPPYPSTTSGSPSSTTSPDRGRVGGPTTTGDDDPTSTSDAPATTSPTTGPTGVTTTTTTGTTPTTGTTTTTAPEPPPIPARAGSFARVETLTGRMDVVVAAAAFAGNGGLLTRCLPPTTDSVTLRIAYPVVPTATSQVLTWSGVGDPDDTITVNGEPVTGAALDDTTVVPFGYRFWQYTAEVPRAPDDTYVVAGLSTDHLPPYCPSAVVGGATLTSFYEHPSLPERVVSFAGGLVPVAGDVASSAWFDPSPTGTARRLIVTALEGDADVSAGESVRWGDDVVPGTAGLFDRPFTVGRFDLLRSPAATVGLTTGAGDLVVATSIIVVADR